MTSVRPVDTYLIEDTAARIADAERAGAPRTPVRNLIGRIDIDTAYRVQDLNADAAVAGRHHVVDRKIGMTSPAVQAQLGADQPDFGVLFDHIDGSSNSL
ncbi:hypothetical protein [Rhodococcus sp. NCIMB 12038]|uniref:hypothetical protein n=1 Tax=Rhodococcus sp. NCIMB 12038 TaxID=933800 RepID=UPI00211AED62|nr:hypothetical protein [Rhodococcus sp. NCIMB 12038]